MAGSCAARAASARRSTSPRASPQIDYDLQWRPKSLLVDGIVRGQDVTLKTTFDGTKASNVIAVQGAPQSKVDAVSADPVVLPNTFLGSYAALARRLQGKTAGAELRAYIAPQAEVTVRVVSAAPERIETPKGIINATRYALTFNNPPPAGDLARQPVGGCGRRPAAHEHPDADDRDGARRHRVGRVAHGGVLRSRRRERARSRASASTSRPRSPSQPAQRPHAGGDPDRRLRSDRSRRDGRRAFRSSATSRAISSPPASPSCATTSAASARAAAAPNR